MELNRHRFEDWLFTQPLGRVIEAGNTSECFLCSFVKETSNLKPLFSFYEWQHGDLPASNSIPEWAMILIDPSWVCNLPGHNGPVTVAQMQARYRELFPDTMPVIPTVNTLDKPIVFEGIQPK